MAENKTYAPGSVKEITFNSGKTILKLGLNVEKFCAFLQQHKNAKGYVNLGISERNEVSAYGETHTLWLDTWSPDASKAREHRPVKPQEPNQPTLPADDGPPESDDVPF